MGDKSLHNSYEKNRAMHMEIARGKIFEREKVAEKIRRREMRRRLLTGDVSEGDITVGSSLRSVSLFAESLNDDDSSLLAASDGSSSDDDELIEINRGTKPKEPMETSPWMDRRPRPNFQWSLYHADGFYDIDVDGEFAEEVPPHLLKVYLQKMEPLERAVDPHILAWASHDVLSAVSNLVSNFSTVEFWHLLEDSMVFHRAGSRAFRNLQLFSLFRRRGRKANNAYKLRLLRLTFEALYQWMHRVAGEGDEKSDAEGIALQARAIRLANLDRRRELQKRMLQIKEDGYN